MPYEFIGDFKGSKEVNLRDEGKFYLKDDLGGSYTIRQYNEDGDIEDTIHFTKCQLKGLFLLLSKEV